MDRIPDTVILAVSIAVFVGGSVWGLAWWLSGQFSSLRHLVYEQITKTEALILSKLEYHERHDDTRFENMRKDMFTIQLRQAAGKGLEKILNGQSSTS